MTQLGVAQTHAVEFAAAAGVPVPWCRVFMQSQPWSPAAYKPVLDAKARGQAVILSNKLPSGATMATVAAGTFDGFFSDVLAGLKAAGVGGVYAFYHEPEDNVAAGEFTAADWRAAQARVGQLVKAAAVPGLRFGTCLMSWTLDPASGRKPDDYYVPAADILLWDAYNQMDIKEPTVPYCTKDPSTTTPAAVLGACVAYAKSKAKPTGLAEFGCPRQQVDTAGARRTAWLQAVAASGLIANFEMCCYFDLGIVDGKAEWAIRAEPASMTAFKGFSAQAPVDPALAAALAKIAALQAQLDAAAAALAAMTSARDAGLTRIASALAALQAP
jgi:hypothetical protein